MAEGNDRRKSIEVTPQKLERMIHGEDIAAEEPLTKEQLEQGFNESLMIAAGEALLGLRQTGRALQRMLHIRGAQLLTNEQKSKLTEKDVPDDFKTLQAIEDFVHLGISTLNSMLEQPQKPIEPGREGELELLVDPEKYIGRMTSLIKKPEEQK